MTSLTATQRKYLRGQAHHLSPVVLIGRAGLTNGVIQNLREALEHHELIKVKFGEFKDQKEDLSAQIIDRLVCEEVGKIGHVVIFYRAAGDPKDRQYRLP